MNDIYVAINVKNAWEWLYVTTIPTNIDAGEVVAALQVLFPMNVGTCIQPAEADDAEE